MVTAFLRLEVAVGQAEGASRRAALADWRWFPPAPIEPCPDHETQTRLITTYAGWRNTHRDDAKLRRLTRRELARKAAVPADTANIA